MGAAERQFYNNLCSAVSADGCTVAVWGLNPESIRKVYLLFKNDHPELFYATNAPMLGRSGFDAYSLFLKSIYPRQEIRVREAALARAVAEVKGKLPPNADEFDKEVAVTEYLTGKVRYAIDNARNQDASSALYAGVAQCSGIANAVKYLFDNLGIRCITVTGEGQLNGTRAAHSWNVVYIGGKPYHLDVTFIIGNNVSKQKPYRFNYFNLSDKQISSTHRWEEGSLPGCAFTYTPPRTPKDAVIMPLGAAYENSDNAVIVNSLYEFRRIFTNELSGTHGQLTFMSKIRCDNDDELMKIISQACRQCLEQKKMRLSLSISITGGVVTVSW